MIVKSHQASQYDAVIVDVHVDRRGRGYAPALFDRRVPTTVPGPALVYTAEWYAAPLSGRRVRELLRRGVPVVTSALDGPSLVVFGALAPRVERILARAERRLTTARHAWSAAIHPLPRSAKITNGTLVVPVNHGVDSSESFGLGYDSESDSVVRLEPTSEQLDAWAKLQAAEAAVAGLKLRITRLYDIPEA